MTEATPKVECGTCDGSGMTGEVLPNGYYNEYTCPECDRSRIAALQTEAVGMIMARRISQDEKNGGYYHNQSLSNEQWIAYITHHAGAALNAEGPDFIQQMVNIAETALAAIEVKL